MFIFLQKPQHAG